MPCVGKLLATGEDEQFQVSVDDFGNSGLHVDPGEEIDDDSGEYDETEVDVKVIACDVLEEFAVDFVTEEKVVHKSR